MRGGPLTDADHPGGTTGTGVRVPVVDLLLRVMRADPDDPDARWWVPNGLASTSVPEAGLARGVVTELHPLD